MHTKNVLNPLQRINTSVDALIRKHGSEKTADYLETIVIGKDLRFDQANVSLLKYIYAETLKIFGIRNSAFVSGKSETSKQARASCFYFYKTFGSLSAQRILNMHKQLGPTRRKIEFCIEKAKDLEETPAVDKKHYSIHQQLKSRIEAYIRDQKK